MSFGAKYYEMGFESFDFMNWPQKKNKLKTKALNNFRSSDSKTDSDVTHKLKGGMQENKQRQPQMAYFHQ